MSIKQLGSEYGRHYVDIELLNKDSIVYSFGIGEDITFDVELIEKVGCTVYGFDPTPKCLEWIKNNNLPDKFKFFEYGLSNKDGNISFDAPPNPDWASYKESITGQFSFPVKKLSTIIKELGHENKKIDFIKMDIEGSEYSVIDDIMQESIHPYQMSVEFHGDEKFILDWVSNNNQLKQLYNAFLFPNKEIFFIKKP